MKCRSRFTIFAASVEERAKAQGLSPAQVVAAMEQERKSENLGVPGFMVQLKKARVIEKGTANPKKAIRKPKLQNVT